MVGIVVSNMEQSVNFYKILGFKTENDMNSSYLELDNNGVRLSLNTRSVITGVYGYEPQKVGDTIELAFLCNSVEEIQEYCSAIRAAGYEIFKEPWLAFWGQHYAIVKDPDGHLISLFAETK